MTIGIPYKYEIQILETEGQYFPTRLDITSKVTNRPKISVSLEGDDTNFGLFRYANLKLVVDNSFNDFGVRDRVEFKVNFPVGFNKTKVFVTYTDQNTDTDILIFTGVVNDIATKIKETEIIFTVLGSEAALSFFKINPGFIGNIPALDAINKILEISSFRLFFAYDVSNISVGFNPTLDNGVAFDNLPMVDVLRELLLISDSILYLFGGSVFVKGRKISLTEEPKRFRYASQFGDNNVLKIVDSFTGLARVFNIIILNETTKSVNDASITTHGTRKKEIKIISIANSATLQSIADNLRDQFAVIKREIDILVSLIKISGRFELLGLASLEINKLLITGNKSLSFWDGGSTWDGTSEYPVVRGTISTNPALGYKLLAIDEQTKEQTLKLKYREVGISDTDNVIPPTTLPDLVLWLSPRDASTVEITDGKVSKINDKSGGTNNSFSQSGAVKRPDIEFQSALGNNNILRFEIDEFLIGDTIINLTANSSAFVIFIVILTNKTIPFTQTFLSINDGSNQGRMQISIQTNGILTFKIFSSTTDFIGRITPINTIEVNSRYVLAFLHDANDNLSILDNNFRIDTADDNAGAFTGYATTNVPFNIAARNGANVYNGDMSDILMYNRSLEREQIQQVFNFLNHEHNFPVNNQASFS